tara:strand:- start:1791 stop:2258 length:468 start_codon:yes stop_codon:yes gene_type:complete
MFISSRLSQGLGHESDADVAKICPRKDKTAASEDLPAAEDVPAVEGAASRRLAPSADEPPLSPRSPSSRAWGSPILVARSTVQDRRSAVGESMEWTEGALMDMTAEEAEEQWLTMTDWTEEREGSDACELVSEEPPPPELCRIDRSGGRLMVPPW